MSDDIDDDHSVDGIADDATGDRTHKVQLGGNLKIEEIEVGAGEWQALGSKTPVPIEKKVAVSVIIVRKTIGGEQSASNQAVEAEMKRVKERYSQIGVDLTWAIKVIDPPAGVDLSDGLDTGTIVNLEITSLFSAATKTTDDIEIFILNKFYRPPAPHYGRGYAEYAAVFHGYKGLDGYENNVIINWDLSSSSIGRHSVAHELGHVLTNDGHSGGAMNLMEVGSLRNLTNDITGGRRLNASQQCSVPLEIGQPFVLIRLRVCIGVGGIGLGIGI